jgi:hypothetical protein
MNAKKPDPTAETPNPAPEDLQRDAEALLARAHATALLPNEKLELKALLGSDAAHLSLWLGDADQGILFEFFVRDQKGSPPKGAFGLALDFAGGVLAEFFDQGRNGGLPLDYVGHPFDGGVVFARQEKRHLKAEAMADAFLAEHGFSEDGD